MAATIAQVTGSASGITKVTIPWTSSAGGSYTEAILLTGFLVQVEFVPGATTPTAAYDITIPNANSIDVLAGTGANLSETTATRKCPCVTATDGTNSSVVPFYLDGSHTFTVANAGNAKNGTVTLWIRN